MRLSPVGEALIKSFEKLELEAYPDPASPLAKECRRRGVKHYTGIPGWNHMDGRPWTIGWGHTGPDVWPGLVITAQKAQELFRADVAPIEAFLNNPANIKRPLAQNQFDALASFAFNCGLDDDSDIIPEGLGDSTLLKYVNQRKDHLAAAEFLKWNKAGGVVLGGLVRRRKAEKDLYLPPENANG